MNFVTSVFKKYIKNESTQENGLAAKLAVDTTNQKPRRSVLKEFDPFAPNSPCPPKPKAKHQPVLIDEEEVYEDAETSLTSYLCPRNKNVESNSEILKTPNKCSNGLRESLLIPGLNDTPQKENPNDTVDLSYTEAIENLSQVDEVLADTKTSSEEDFEFNTKVRPIIPELTENNSLNVTTDLGKTLDIDKSNAMVDSLENTDTGFNEMESENADSLVTLNKSQPSEVIIQKISVNATENIQEINTNMIDSLELSKTQTHEPELETKTLVNHNDALQESLVDSLEISKTSAKSEVPVDSVAYQKEVSDSIAVIQTSKQIDDTSTPYPEEALADEICINGQSMNNLSDDLDKKESSGKAELNSTFERPLNTNGIQDKNNENNIESSSEINKTFEGSPEADELSKTSPLPSIENSNEIPEIGKNLGNGMNPNDKGNTLVTLNAGVVLPLSNQANHKIEKSEHIRTSSVNIPKENVSTLESQDKRIEVEKENPANGGGVMNNTFNADKCIDVIETKPDLLLADDNTSHNGSSKNMEDNQHKGNAGDDKDTDKLDFNKTFDSCSKIPEDTFEYNPETTRLKQDSSVILENDNYETENNSISLQDIGIELSDKVEAKAEQVEKIDSNSPKNPVASSEAERNSTLTIEEHAAESSRVMEAMAQSLNQTIDIEESAIVDEVNSTNTSDETSQENVLDVTVGNIKEDNDYQEPDSENKVASETKQLTENQKSNKVVERKETEEFEDIERQYNENSQNTDKSAKEPVVSYENIEPLIEQKADGVAEKDLSRVYFRQDTREFEQLEIEFKENGQNTKVSNSQKMSDVEPILETICDLDEKKKKCEENIEIQNKSKVSSYQEKKKIEELKGECIANDEITVNDVSETAELPEKTGHVKVRVSGNMCNANSVVETLVQIDNTDGAYKPDLEVNIESNLNKSKKDDSRLSNLERTETQNAGDVIMNGTKTDEAVSMCNINQNSTITKSDKQQEVCDNSTKPTNRVECRPNIRSMRNKTQVIEAPVFIKEVNKAVNSSSSGSDITLVPNDRTNEELIKYKSKSVELKNQVDELQSEKDTLKKENMRKDKYILTCALEIQVERDLVARYKRMAADYEKVIANQCEDLRRLKEETEKSAKNFTSLEMAFANVFANYERTKTVIDAYKKNEEILQKNIDSAEHQLTQLEAKCSVMTEQYTKQLKETQDLVLQEKEKYRHDITQLQAKVKRLEIKASSLETSLKQKTEECQQLSSLCDDITGKTM